VFFEEGFMKRFDWRFSRRTALSVTILGGVTAAFIAGPSRGQQNLPVIHVTVPATVAGGAAAHVQYDLTLPAGLQPLRNPRVLVVNDTGRLWELLPMYLTQRTPAWAGFRDLHSENYPPGKYLVSVEADYLRPDGSEATVSTPVVPLILAAPVSGAQ
jgi:hypothetical protein